MNYYDKKDYISATELKALAKSIPEFWQAREGKVQLTKAMILGQLIHLAIQTQGDKKIIEQNFAIEPENINRRTKNYKEWIATQDNPIVSYEDLQTALKLTQILYDSPIAKLISGNFEEEFYDTITIPDYDNSNANIYKENETKVKVKCKPDNYNLSKNLIIDFKTTAEIPTIRNMQKIIMKYRYDIQAGLYSLILSKKFKKEFNFLFIFLKKIEPFDINWIIISSETLETAQGYARNLLSLAKYLIDNNLKYYSYKYNWQVIPQFSYNYLPEHLFINDKIN